MSTPRSSRANSPSRSSNSLPASGSSSGKPLKPIGIVNESNTCFLNSTFQALSATAPLTSLLSYSPQSPLTPVPTSALPPPVVSPSLIPSLQSDALEPPLYELLPVTRAFTAALHRAWRMKDAGGGTTGATETNSNRSMSLRSVLREIAKKYDQYDDYSQQDAHELLRHLLDSMEMEEKDVVKRIQPPPPLAEKKRRRKTKAVRPKESSGELKHISPMPSPLPSPAHSIPSSPTHGTFIDPMATARPYDKGQVTGESFNEGQVSDPAQTNGDGGSSIVEIPEGDRLIPFVDVLFGGSLASVVVCEKCKSVSHTYEGFLDISLSLKGDDPKPRKRDRLRAMAQRLRPKGSGSKASDSSHAAVSDGELSEPEKYTADRSSNRRRSLDQEDGSETGLSRHSSSKGISGLKNKTSFSFKRKGSRQNSSSSSLPDVEKTPPAQPVQPEAKPQASHAPHHHHGAGPTPAQAAYIARILSAPSVNDPLDPLAKLRAANNGDHTSVPVDSGLVEALKAFTQVEVLEGENAFACKKCWRIKHGWYTQHEATVPEEDDEDDVARRPSNSSLASKASTSATSPSLLTSPRFPPPSIAILGSPESGITDLPDDNSDRTGRSYNITSPQMNHSQVRGPSPLRRRADGMEALSAQISHSTLNSVYTESSLSTIDFDADAEAEDASSGSDGLSDSETESEEERAHDGGKPKPHKKKSVHFVMGRAFKRYLIAKAPEIMVFHFKRFKQTHKSNMGWSSFYDLKK
ncbi:hypothetical protein CI109_100487 [Kwoniella shandongensis]|uniref:USP domain-containing protein n=1 Tax=Kwoniella shandongensis TaxID=1734106 RepID=A0AAJ8MUP9_9TREE